MKDSRAHVQALALPVKAKRDISVDGDSNQRRYDHHRALDRLRVGEPAGSLDGDGDDDDDQGYGVHQGGQDGDPLVAVAAATVGGTPGLLDGEPGQAERENIREYVACIRKKGQGVGDQSAGQLDGEYQACQQECPLQGRPLVAYRLQEFILPTCSTAESS